MKHEISNYNTKKQLSGALKILLKNKTLPKITISELTEKSGLNRKTFYYHFSDIHQLLKWTLKQEAIDILKEYGRMSDFAEAIDFVVEYIYENKSFLLSIYNSVGSDELSEFFYDDFREAVIMAIAMHEKSLKINLSEQYKSFLSNFYTHALTGCVFDILKDENNKSKTVISDYILLTLSTSLPEIIKTAGKKYQDEDK